MLDEVIKWLVPFVLGSLVTLVGTFFVKLKAIKEGLQCLLRMEIVRSHEKYMEKGYCRVHVKESLTRAYKAYHALNGNDVATGLFHEVLELPTEPPVDNSVYTN